MYLKWGNAGCTSRVPLNFTPAAHEDLSHQAQNFVVVLTKHLAPKLKIIYTSFLYNKLAECNAKIFKPLENVT